MGWVLNAAPRPLYPRETPGTNCRRFGGPQGRSERVGKSPSLTGFDPRTVQPLANRYTDRAIPAHQTSVQPVGFEPTISAGERPQTYALDRAANWTGVDWQIRISVPQQHRRPSSGQKKDPAD